MKKSYGGEELRVEDKIQLPNAGVRKTGEPCELSGDGVH